MSVFGCYVEARIHHPETVEAGMLPDGIGGYTEAVSASWLLRLAAATRGVDGRKQWRCSARSIKSAFSLFQNPVS